MPLIPDDYQEQDVLHPGPGAGLGEDATPALFGQGVASSLSVTGEIATRVHYDAANAANQTAVMDRMNMVEQSKQTIMRDPKNGLMYQQTGAQSPAAAAKALSDFQQQVGQARAGLANDQQREDFDRKAGITLDHMRAETDGYVGGQLDKHTDDVYATAHQLQLSAVAHDPSTAGDQLAKSTGSIEQYAAAKGYAPGSDSYKEFVDDQTRKATNQIHATAIQAYLAQDNAPGAKAYLDAHRDEITDPGILRNAEDTTKAAGTEQQGQNIALEFLQGTKIAGSGGLFNRAQFNEQLENDPRLKDDVRLREAVARTGSAMIEQHQAAAAETHNQNFQTVFNSLDKTSGAITSDMAALKATLPPDQQEALEHRADTLAKPGLQAQAEKDQNEGDFAYGNFFQRANEDPKFLKNMTAAQLYSQYHDTFSDKQYEHALDMLGKAHKEDPNGIPDEPGAEGNPLTGSNADVYQIGKSAGLDLETMGRFAPAAAAALDAALDANKNVPLTDKQKQDAVGPLLVQAVFVPNPPPTFAQKYLSPWQDLKDRFIQPGPAGRYVPAPLLTPEERQRLSPATLQRIDTQTRPAGTPTIQDWRTLTSGNKPQR